MNKFFKILLLICTIICFSISNYYNGKDMIKVEGIVTDKYRTPVINRTPLLRYFIEVHPKEIQYKDFNIEVEFDEYINTKIGNTVIYSVRQSSVIKNNSTNYGTYAVLYFIGGLVFLIILLITFIQ